MLSLTGLFMATATLAQQGEPRELVRNGGFEVLDKDVTTYDQLSYASGWSNATNGLSEVFAPGASEKTVGIPLNDYGLIKPFEGEHYAGFFGWKDDVRRNFGASDPMDLFKPGWNFYSEYPQVELVEPLKEDQEYEFVMRVALAGNSDRSIRGLGMHPVLERISETHRKFLELNNEVEFEEMLLERNKWVELRTRFKASGDEQFLVIGVFPWMGLESERIIEGHDNQYAYFYLDGVSLKEVRPEQPDQEGSAK